MPNYETSSRIHQSIVTILEGRASKYSLEKHNPKYYFEVWPSARRIHVTRQNLRALAYHEWLKTPTYGRNKLGVFANKWISEALIMGLRVDVFGHSIVVDLVEVAPE